MTFPLTICKDILTYIYQYVPVSKMKFKPLNTPDTVTYLKEKSHYISPNYYGYTCYMVFMRQNNELFSCLVDRKCLMSNFDDIDLKNVSIEPLEIEVTSDVYDGTIIEGVFTCNRNNKSIFVITDAFYLGGRNMLKTEVQNKLHFVSDFIKNEFNPNDDLEIRIEKMRTYAEMGDLLYKDIPELDIDVRGLAFYPKVSGLRIIYNLTQKIGYEKKQSKDNIRFSKNLDVYDLPEADILLKKTKTVDVYNMYLLENNEYKKFGLASIPTIECSQFCSDIFKKENQAVVKCRYKDGKWIPYEKTDAEEPENYKSVITKINTFAKITIKK